MEAFQPPPIIKEEKVDENDTNAITNTYQTQNIQMTVRSASSVSGPIFDNSGQLDVDSSSQMLENSGQILENSCQKYELDDQKQFDQTTNQNLLEEPASVSTILNNKTEPVDIDPDNEDEKFEENEIPTTTEESSKLKSFNNIVRSLVTEKLDRYTPYVKQPEDQIQAIVDFVSEQFPEFAPKARKRIRIYLKHFRRSKKLQEEGGNVEESGNIMEDSNSDGGNGNYHQKTVSHGKNSRKFQCEICYKGFANNYRKRRHEENVHKMDRSGMKFQKPLPLDESMFEDSSMIDGYDNPWAVLSIFEFQYFNCPSCVFKTHSKKEFINHAMKVHPESIIHLSNIQDINNGNDINSDVNIKEEPGIEKYLEMGLNEYTAMEDQDDSYFEDYFGDMNEDDEKANEDSDKLKDFHVGYFLFNDNLKCQNMLDENDLAKHFKKFARPRYDAYVRQLVDENLDKLVPISNQPEEKIQEIIDMSSEQYPEFESKVRKRIREYLKHCRRTQNKNNSHKIERNSNHPDSENIEEDDKEALVNRMDNSEDDISEDGDNYQCPKCPKSFTLSNSFKKHLIVAHQNTCSYQCKKCPKEFPLYSTLQRHMRNVHESVRNFQCDQCEAAFANNYRLQRHLTNVHKIGKNISDDEMIKVEQPHNNSSSSNTTTTPKKFQICICEKCSKTFPDNYKLKRHIHQVHDKKFDCGKCEETFVTYSDLRKHTAAVHGVTYRCEQCNRTFKDSYGLKRHIQTVHEGIKNFLCDKCDKTFAELNLLKKHEMVHEGVKNFQCEHCNKAYYTLRLLKRHLGMQHDDGTNQFRCDKCPRTFPELNILNKHISITHEGLRKYQCDQCDKAFGQLSTLKYHIISIHDQVKNHECHICKKAFALPGNLRAHIKKTHGVLM